MHKEDAEALRCLTGEETYFQWGGGGGGGVNLNKDKNHV